MLFQAGIIVTAAIPEKTGAVTSSYESARDYMCKPACVKRRVTEFGGGMDEVVVVSYF